MTQLNYKSHHKKNVMNIGSYQSYKICLQNPITSNICLALKILQKDMELSDKGLVVRKPVFRVSDLVRHKPGCTGTEDG